MFALVERHLEQGLEALLTEAAALRAEQPNLADTIRRLVTAVAELHASQPHLHRVLFEQAPRTADSSARLRQLERTIAAEVECHLRRLGAGGTDPALTGLLLVQGVEAHAHGAVLDPPPERTTQQCLDAVIDLWTHALSTPPR